MSKHMERVNADRAAEALKPYEGLLKSYGATVRSTGVVLPNAAIAALLYAVTETADQLQLRRDQPSGV